MLEIAKLSAGYKQSAILHDISFTLNKGNVHGIVGRNGAGKSTLCRTIMGLNTITSGEISFENQNTTNASPIAMARAGIAYVPEERAIFPSLSVKENLMLGAKDSDAALLKTIFELFPRLKERQHNSGTSLSGGEQQMLAIARALITKPKLIILDEPMEGLAPNIVKQVEEALQKLKKQKLTILIIEQTPNKLMEIADSISVFHNGNQVWLGETQLINKQKENLKKWLGV